MAKFLGAEQRALLDAVLDRLIPAEGAMPGAGQNGTADYIDGVAGRSARMARLFGRRDYEASSWRRPSAARASRNWMARRGTRFCAASRRTSPHSSRRCWDWLTMATTRTRKWSPRLGSRRGRRSRKATRWRSATSALWTRCAKEGGRTDSVGAADLSAE